MDTKNPSVTFVSSICSMRSKEMYSFNDLTRFLYLLLCVSTTGLEEVGSVSIPWTSRRFTLLIVT